jgi:hypothetical protein
MANINAPRGLIPYRRASGEPYNSAGNMYWVPSTYATALYVGDPVQIVSGSADNIGVPSIQLVTAGNGTDTSISTYGLIGSIASRISGGEPQIPVLQNNPVYIPASSTGGTYVLVYDDPDTLYVVQENGNMAGSGPAGSYTGPGKNVDLVSGAGSTVTGFSGWQLGSASLSTSALQMRVLRMLEQADNAIGTNAKWLCRINLNQLTNSTGT